jgi:quinol monooxygenase YgiN
MRGAASLLLSCVLLSSSLGASLRAQGGDAAVYAVAYVEFVPTAGRMVAAAFKQYQDASRKEDGFVGVELREQVGRPGVYTVIEAWRDQRAFDAHAAAAHTRQYQDALTPLRVAGYDQRPYKPLSVSPARDGSAQAVHVVAHVDIGQGGQVNAPMLLTAFAEKSRAEQGNLRFDVLQHMTRANHFTVVEVWRDQKALDAHRAAAHTREYRDVLQQVTGSPLDERFFKGVE